MNVYSPILPESHHSKSFVGLWLMLAAAPVVAGDGWDRHAETIAAQNLEAQTGLTEFALLPGERLAQAGSSPTGSVDTVVGVA